MRKALQHSMKSAGKPILAETRLQQVTGTSEVWHPALPHNLEQFYEVLSPRFSGAHGGVVIALRSRHSLLGPF